MDMYPATIRELTSPTEDTLSPTYDGDRAWRSGELTTNTTCGHHGNYDDPSSHPANSRSTLRSVLLVLTCSGSIIINVSRSC